MLAGTVAGALLLGVGGRVAMAVLAVVGGSRPSFSWGGSTEVVLLGVAYGAVGGLVLWLTARVLPVRRAGGATVGCILFAVAWLTSGTGRQAASGLGGRFWPALGVALLLFLLYGTVADYLRGRWSPRRGPVSNSRLNL